MSRSKFSASASVPRLFGFRRGETDYRFSLILFGGYVKMAGEQPGDESVRRSPRPCSQAALAAPHHRVRGPFMNVVLAIGVLTGLYMVNLREDHREAAQSSATSCRILRPPKPAFRRATKSSISTAKIIPTGKISSPGKLKARSGPCRSPSSATASAFRHGHAGPRRQGRRRLGGMGRAEPDSGGRGHRRHARRHGRLQKGDLLVKINSIPIHSRYTLPEIIRKSEGKPVTIEYTRDDVSRTTTLKPVFKNPDGTARWMIGVQSDAKWHIQKMKLSFPDAVHESMVQNGKNAEPDRRVSARHRRAPHVGEESRRADRHRAACDGSGQRGTGRVSFADERGEPESGDLQSAADPDPRRRH